jgi:hypothetical protein
MHENTHEFAGETVNIEPKSPIPNFTGSKFRVEEWWDKLTGKSWMFSDGNPAALMFAMRSGMSGLPLDDEVVYGHDEASIGHLVHVSELVKPE